MRRLMWFTLAVVAVLAVASVAAATTPAATKAKKPAAQPAFDVQGKVLKVGKGWLEVEVTKVKQGAGIKVNAKLRILQTSRTKILKAGKPVASTMLKVGEPVEISGTIVRSGKTLTYQATSVTIME